MNVDWGDGTAAQDLGAISGNVSVSHVYKSLAPSSINGTVTDVFGNSSKVSTSITVDTGAEADHHYHAVAGAVER